MSSVGEVKIESGGGALAASSCINARRRWPSNGTTVVRGGNGVGGSMAVLRLFLRKGSAPVVAVTSGGGSLDAGANGTVKVGAMAVGASTGGAGEGAVEVIAGTEAIVAGICGGVAAGRSIPQRGQRGINGLSVMPHP